jgi:hypothetical protein
MFVTQEWFGVFWYLVGMKWMQEVFILTAIFHVVGFSQGCFWLNSVVIYMVFGNFSEAYSIVR